MVDGVKIPEIIVVKNGLAANRSTSRRASREEAIASVYAIYLGLTLFRNLF